ncbi:hypothetical protein Glove_564g73 [Diversispora epigaea]|uniref:Uncharacterized protein n=1 Tax=Diversispora epigaea TaxID=1348612 RepID=A0A397GDM3_9GLOM|nr:hypothetical protein Glove_564g73 [Diversispora epigaea]
MKLMHVNVNLGPKASQFDLMKDHYDYECSRPQIDYGYSRPRTEFGCARVIQRLWRNFREREPSDARLAWNSLSNDNTPDDKKFLGLTRLYLYAKSFWGPEIVKNSQTQKQFNQWHTKWIELYKQCNSNIPLDIYARKYEEYYILYSWTGCKKDQLEREPSDARLAWNSLSNDNTPDDKKFLGLTRLYLYAKSFWGPEIGILGEKVEIVFHRRRNYFT